MASREGMLFKFFEKWKNNRLNKFSKKMLKDNPSLEKDLKELDKISQDVFKKIRAARK